MDSLFSQQIIITTLSNATPLFLAALGGVFNERVGIVNIGLEGIMLSGAFTAVITTYYTGSAWLGLFSSLIIGVVLGLLHAFLTVTMQADHTVSGVAINILASSLTVFLMQLLFNNKGQSPTVNSIGGLGDALVGIPILGVVFRNMNYLTIIGLVLIVLCHFILYRTTIGLRLRSVGENPYAAEAIGLSVKKYMYGGVLFGSMLVGLAGAYLSIGDLNVFTQNMSAGRGFIALSIMIFGRWTPFGSLLASLFFGYIMAIQISLPGGIVPAQIIEALPYVVTIIVLAFANKNARGPAFSGKTYQKQN